MVMEAVLASSLSLGTHGGIQAGGALQYDHSSVSERLILDRSGG